MSNVSKPPENDRQQSAMDESAIGRVLREEEDGEQLELFVNQQTHSPETQSSSPPPEIPRPIGALALVPNTGVYEETGGGDRRSNRRASSLNELIVVKRNLGETIVANSDINTDEVFGSFGWKRLAMGLDAVNEIAQYEPSDLHLLETIHITDSAEKLEIEKARSAVICSGLNMFEKSIKAIKDGVPAEEVAKIHIAGIDGQLVTDQSAVNTFAEILKNLNQFLGTYRFDMDSVRALRYMSDTYASRAGLPGRDGKSFPEAMAKQMLKTYEQSGISFDPRTSTDPRFISHKQDD